MTQPISRRSVAKAGVWSAPVIAASAAVPAYAASSRSDDSEEKLTIQSGLFVSAQYGGGFVGYASSTSTGPIHPTTPEAYFASSSKPQSDLNWDDSASKPTNPDLFSSTVRVPLPRLTTPRLHPPAPTWHLAVSGGLSRPLRPRLVPATLQVLPRPWLPGQPS